MLAHLKVRDLVLIDALDIDLSSKFNVITGETGAGKSLVATAVDLLLGRRAAGEMVRHGCPEAEVEGLFDIEDEPEVKARLEEAGLPADDELLVRRVIPAKGRHKCYVNGRLASLSLLSRLAEGLARVTSQHEQHTLADPASRLATLDSFGGLEAMVAEMQSLYASLSSAQRDLKALESRERDRASRLDYLKFQLEEITRISPRPGELEEIEKEAEKLKHQALLSSTAAQAVEGLYEGNNAAFELISRIALSLENCSRYDTTLGALADSLRDAAAVVEDAAMTLAKYERSLDADPEQLDAIEQRKEELKSLVRKHGVPVDEVVTLGERIAGEIETLEAFEEAKQEAIGRVAECLKRAREHAVSLSRKRRQASKQLSKRVVSELEDLMFSKAGFDVRIESEPETLSRAGIDQVSFLVSLNPGEGAHPIQKVASGGELSRLMLAIKRAVAGMGPVGTYIFDEVDAGIGGPVASAVGRKLKEVSTCHQVICITHLAQIAGMADHHLFISKTEAEGRTTSAVVPLRKNDRIEELARMLAGDQVTAKTRAAAKELIAS